MDIPILEYIKQLTIIETIVLVTCGIVALYFCFTYKIPVIMSLLVLSGALVSTTIPIISSIASLARWLLILLLLLSSLLFGKIKISFGVFLFWMYAFLGFVTLLNAHALVWQFQRSSLLIIVAMAIPFAFGDRSYNVYKQSLILIALVATLYALINFISLPGSLGDPERFRGYSTTVPVFANTLGALLPFTLWGAWKAESPFVRIICGLGFLAGTLTLMFSGQRTGTVTGIVSLVPLVFAILKKRKNVVWAILLFVLLFLSGYYLYLQSSPDKLEFLLNRYSISAGLSGREYIWQKAFAEIAKSPFLGKGTGAAETFISNSFHNTYLEVWYNTGLLGLFFFLGAELYYLQRIFSLMHINNKADSSSIFTLSLGYMLGFIVLNTFEAEGSTASGVILMLYIFLGVLVSSRNLFDGIFVSQNQLKYKKA